MSWHFLQEQEAVSWEGNCLDGAPSALLKLMIQRDECCLLDSTTGFLIDSQYGTMLRPSVAMNGEEQLTLFPVGSLAQISAQQEKEQELMVKNHLSGKKCTELFLRYDLVSRTWRTRRYSEQEVLPWSLVILQKSGMALNGVVYPLAMSELTTSVNECGELLSTPTATANQDFPSMMKHKGCRNFVMAMYPTPTAHNAKEGAYPAEFTRRTPTLATHVGGLIHPEFTEWLMGWPIGWTDYKPLGTDRFQEWRHAHGNY